MKPFFVLLLSALIFLAPQAFGQLLLQEDFLTPTADITTIGTWTLVNNVGPTMSGPPNIVVNAGSALQYPGYIESGVGNSAYLVGTGQDAQIGFTTTAMTGVYYAAFLLKIDSVSTTGDYFWMVRNSSNHNRWRGWVKRSAGNEDSVYFGVTKGATPGANAYSTKKYKMSGTTHLLVAKYDFNTASTTDALLSLWVDPPSSSFGKTDPAGAAVLNYSESATSDYATLGMNRFAVIQNTAGLSPTYWIGGIRLASDWKTALPPSPLYYNFAGTGDPSDVNNWGTNVDGTGTPPSDFSAPDQWYLMRNATPSVPKNVTFNNFWLIPGVGSKLILGSGVNFTVGITGTLNATVDVSSGASLTLQGSDNASWPVFGTNAGTVNFDNAAGTTLAGDQLLPTGSGNYVLRSGDFNIGSFTLRVQGRFNPNGYKITGAGTFFLDSAGSLIINSPVGIAASGATGDIQTTTRKFSKYGTYQYGGSVNQVTGTGIPDTVLNLTVSMANRTLTTTLSKSVLATNNLSLTLGKCVLGNYNLNFNNPGGSSDSSYVITNGTGVLSRPISSTSAKTMPLGSAQEFRKTVFTFESAPTSGRIISFQYIADDTASVGFPNGITYRYKGGYWKITSDSVTSLTYKLDLTVPLGFVTDTTSLRLIWRGDNASAWDTVGTTGVYVAGVQSQAGINKFGQFALGVGASAPPPPPGKRYVAEAFTSYQIQSGVQYGTASQQLADIYTGTGDTVKNRPLVIFVPGGGFKAVNAPGGFSDILCGGLAKRGYVVGYVRYYRTSSTIANDTVHFETMLKALQDVKAAVRYFRKNGAAFGIDTSQIFATGSSAGSITSLHLAYLDSAEVPKYVTWSNVGGSFEGLDRGTPGCSSRVQGVISNWGAIGDTAWIKPGNVPAYFVHGTSDSTVYYDNIPADGPFLYSSKYIYQAMQKKGITTGLRLFYGTGHTLDNSAAKQDSGYKDAAAWLYTILKAPQSVPANTVVIPTTVVLDQNYPNPFNPATTIRYQVPSQMRVTLKVYNTIGQLVKTIVDENSAPGTYAATFDASHYASGVYIYQLHAGAVVQTRKMLMLK